MLAPSKTVSHVKSEKSKSEGSSLRLVIATYVEGKNVCSYTWQVGKKHAFPDSYNPKHVSAFFTHSSLHCHFMCMGGQQLNLDDPYPHHSMIAHLLPLVNMNSQFLQRRLPAYLLPHAHRDTVKAEIREMLAQEL